MRIATLAVALLALPSVAAVAATGPTDRAPDLGTTIATLESRYPGKVVAIALDDGGDKPAHYHVDMQFPASGLAELDVDAATLAIASRDTDAPSNRPYSMAYAVARLATSIPGEVTYASLDASSGPAHYDVDVALRDGGVARLRVDARTGDITWRRQAISRD